MTVIDTNAQDYKAVCADDESTFIAPKAAIVLHQLAQTKCPRTTSGIGLAFPTVHRLSANQIVPVLANLPASPRIGFDDSTCGCRFIQG